MNEMFTTAKVLVDTTGDSVQAHGGGFMFYEGKYYWYGENTYIKNSAPALRKGSADLKPEQKAYYQSIMGVSCYTSADLYNWKNEGVVLPVQFDDENHDLYFNKVLERPKVIYNQKTKQFVMWMHADSRDYAYARAGIAVADNPLGPFTYLGAIRPNGQMSRDMTLFQDDDGKAYHICSSEENSTMYISLLADDYLHESGVFTRNFERRWREAPAMFKYNHRYYLITSSCTGWAPNAAEIAVADSPLGPFSVLGNPCIGEDAEKTFHSQSTAVIMLSKDRFIFVADRWNPDNLFDSRYLFLPIHVNEEKPSIAWADAWKIEDFK